MIPRIGVRQKDEPVDIIEPTTLSLWLTEESVPDGNRWATMLAVAYYNVVGETAQAVDISTIREWARINEVRIEEITEDDRPDPTQAASTGS